MAILEVLAVITAVLAFLIICAFAVVGVVLVFGDDITWEELKEERKYFNKDEDNK